MTAGLVSSRDGTRIATRSFGAAGRPALLLIHGWAQRMSCWQALADRLATDHHVVAMDLRGHGGSDKPAGADAYTDTGLWAADVQAVIDHHRLRRPVLVGWSYGSRVIAAHLDRHGGGAALGGVVLAGGILATGKARPDWMLGAASPALDRDLYADDPARLIPATARFVAACTARPLPRQAYAEMVGANMLCPPHVRRALFAVDLDLRPVYAAMACPGLAIHGTADAIVAPATGAEAARVMPRGNYLPYEGIGHAPFLEDPDRFAADIRAFAAERQEAA